MQKRYKTYFDKCHFEIFYFHLHIFSWAIQSHETVVSICVFFFSSKYLGYDSNPLNPLASAQGVEHLGPVATGHDVAHSQSMQRSQQCESLHVKSRRFASRPPCLCLGLNARKNARNGSKKSLVIGIVCPAFGGKTPLLPFEPTPLASVLSSASLSSKALKKVTEVEVMIYSFSEQTTWMFSGRR